jgi:choline-sulfatase
VGRHGFLVTPHYPLTVPAEFLDLYADRELPVPLRNAPSQWDRHPALDHYRRSCGLDEPLTAEQTRRALRHYYGLVSFMDAQIGTVLDALADTGMADHTVVLYVSDHGELMGTDGTWFKGTMAEHSVRVPCSSPDGGVEAGARCATNASIVDIYPTILDALGLSLATEDADLPGRSLLDIAASGHEPDRTVFAEYHSANSASGGFMICRGAWKYVHHVGLPERLFDVVTDPTNGTTSPAIPGTRISWTAAARSFSRSVVRPVWTTWCEPLSGAA